MLHALRPIWVGFTYALAILSSKYCLGNMSSWKNYFYTAKLEITGVDNVKSFTKIYKENCQK